MRGDCVPKVALYCGVMAGLVFGAGFGIVLMVPLAEAAISVGLSSWVDVIGIVGVLVFALVGTVGGALGARTAVNDYLSRVCTAWRRPLLFPHMSRVHVDIRGDRKDDVE